MKSVRIIYGIILHIIFLSSLMVLITCRAQDKYIDVFQASWDEIEQQAKGEKVYFNAWGGSNHINEYIQWVAKEVKARYDIELVHVLLQDPFETVRRIQQEKAANKMDGGSVDLFWLNGNAFHVLKEQNLFLGNILDLIPNKKYINSNNPVLFEDFTVPTEGLEVPWGTAQLTFFYRSDRVEPITSLVDFEEKMKKYRGSFTYPNPTMDFTGRTFLKNLVYHFAEDKSIFYRPFEGSVDHESAIADNGVWKFLDTLHPFFWDEGRVFPSNVAEMINYFKDSGTHYGITFNPYYPLNQVLSGEFPDTVRTFLVDEGTVSNAHFLSIPFNASAKAAALLVIDFLLSPEAQARKADPTYWGDSTVIDINKLSTQEKEFFERVVSSSNPSGPPQSLGENTIKEFHSSWEKPIQEFWEKLYLK